MHILIGPPKLLGEIALERGMYSGTEVERHRAVVNLGRPEEPGQCQLCSLDFLLWLWDTTEVHRAKKRVRNIPSPPYGMDAKTSWEAATANV